MKVKVYTVLSFFIISLLIFMLVGCNKAVMPSLKRVDDILSVNYERGKIMLDSIYKSDANMSETNKRYCELLWLKADDKAYRSIKDKKARVDSLVKYFKHSDDKDILAETYFYAGRVYYEIGDTPEALHFYQRASEIVSADNYALIGDIYCQMSNIYRSVDLFSDALKALNKALIADSLNSNYRNVLYDYRDIGEIYRNCDNIRQAEKYFLKGLYCADMSKDSFMKTAFHHELAAIYKKKQDWGKALFHVNKYFPYILQYTDNSGMLVTALEVYAHFDNESVVDKCRKEIFHKGNTLARQFAYENLICARLVKSKDTQTLDLFRSYVAITDSVIKENKTIGIKRVERMYNYELKEKENKYLRKENIISYFLLGLSSIIGLFIFLYFRMKVMNMKQSQKILDLKNEKYKAIKEKAVFKTLEKLEKEQMLIKNSLIYKLISNEIENNTFKVNKENWLELQKLLNDVFPNYDKNLLSFLDVTQSEYRICLLIKIGIKPTNIAKFMNLTKEAISASRRRMYFKAFKVKGTPSDWDKVVKSL